MYVMHTFIVHWQVPVKTKGPRTVYIEKKTEKLKTNEKTAIEWSSKSVYFVYEETFKKYNAHVIICN